MKQPANLDLGVVGNGTFGALIDSVGSVVWSCLPAFDGDPAFCALLSPRNGGGEWSVELEHFASSEQQYVPNTAILRTILRDTQGGVVEITDFAPRWRHYNRLYRPVGLFRRVRPLAGSPRIRVRMSPLADWGAREPERTWGSNHMRWLLQDHVLRLTTDLSLRMVRDELPFVLDRE